MTSLYKVREKRRGKEILCYRDQRNYVMINLLYDSLRGILLELKMDLQIWIEFSLDRPQCLTDKETIIAVDPEKQVYIGKIMYRFWYFQI